MRRHWWMKGFAFLICAPAFLAVMSLVVMWLWNALIPSLFAGPMLGFWQAVGLLLLCRILFGGFRRVGPPGWAHHRHRRWHKRWHRMAPEERERFREGFRRWRYMDHNERRQFKKDFGNCGPRSRGPWSGGRGGRGMGDPGRRDGGDPDPRDADEAGRRDVEQSRRRDEDLSGGQGQFGPSGEAR